MTVVLGKKSGKSPLVWAFSASLYKDTTFSREIQIALTLRNIPSIANLQRFAAARVGRVLYYEGGFGLDFFNLPVRNCVALRIKVDAHLDNGQAAEGEARGIVLQVDLLHGCFGRAVEFEFKDVEVLGGT